MGTAVSDKVVLRSATQQGPTPFLTAMLNLWPNSVEGADLGIDRGT